MKTIDKFLGKDKKPDPGTEESRSEAMTLEEMAVKAQERKILGTERKVDMNIIMFVALCLSGLIIINVVLYFLIDESKSSTMQPSPLSQNARGLLKERREERAAMTSLEGTAEQAVERLTEHQSLENADISSEMAINTQPESQILDAPAQDVYEQSAAADVVPAPVETPDSEPSAQPVEEFDASGIEQQTPPTTEDSTEQERQPELLEERREEPEEEPLSLVQEAEETTEATTEQAGPLRSESEEIPFDLVISVGSTINDWSNAWSAQNVEKYLSYYADSFVSEAGMNIEEWRAHRAIRLTKPEWISIGIEHLKINAIDGGAKAEFVQEYNASNYSDKELKKMIFRRVEGEWKIFDERATPVK